MDVSKSTVVAPPSMHLQSTCPGCYQSRVYDQAGPDSFNLYTITLPYSLRPLDPFQSVLLLLSVLLLHDLYRVTTVYYYIHHLLPLPP